MRWFLAFLHCAICNEEHLSLHPDPAGKHGLECPGCGYMIPRPPDEQEVPESFAKAEHTRLGLRWTR